MNGIQEVHFRLNFKQLIWLLVAIVFTYMAGTLGKSGIVIKMHVFSDENVPYFICRFHG